jgi:hypothetical protein
LPRAPSAKGLDLIAAPAPDIDEERAGPRSRKCIPSEGAPCAAPPATLRAAVLLGAGDALSSAGRISGLCAAPATLRPPLLGANDAPSSAALVCTTCAAPATLRPPLLGASDALSSAGLVFRLCSAPAATLRAALRAAVLLGAGDALPSAGWLCWLSSAAPATLRAAALLGADDAPSFSAGWLCWLCSAAPATLRDAAPLLGTTAVTDTRWRPRGAFPNISKQSSRRRMFSAPMTSCVGNQSKECERQQMRCKRRCELAVNTHLVVTLFRTS